MPIVERRIAIVVPVVTEAGSRGAWLGPGVDPGLAIFFGVASALDLCVHEAAVRPARRALLRVVFVHGLLAWREVLVEDEEVVARQALGRILAQLPLRDERVRTVHDDQLVEHL